MSSRRGRKDAARPRIPSRLVFEDWIYGVHVRGYRSDSHDVAYLVYVKAWSGSTICTIHFPLDWWNSLMGDKKNAIQKSYVQKALGAKAPGGGGITANDAALASACPALHEFLTLSVLPDGSTRTPSTLLLFCDGGLWKAALNEKDSSLVLWATSETLQGLWAELEARLNAPVVDWRASRPWTGAKAPGKAVDKK